MRQLGDTVDLTTFDFQSGRTTQQNCFSQHQHLVFQRPSLSATLKRSSSDNIMSTSTPASLKQPYEFRLMIFPKQI